jgi:hypothetical protein
MRRSNGEQAIEQIKKSGEMRTKSRGGRGGGGRRGRNEL